MEFASGVLGSEPPVNGSSYRVPLRHAGADGSFQAVFISVASAQAGPGQHAELDLRILGLNRRFRLLPALVDSSDQSQSCLRSQSPC